MIGKYGDLKSVNKLTIKEFQVNKTSKNAYRVNHQVVDIEQRIIEEFNDKFIVVKFFEAIIANNWEGLILK